MKEMATIYRAIADNFKPRKISKLIVAESPPLSGRYFYLPKQPCIGFGKTIFLHEFRKAPKNVEEYYEFLVELKKRRIFMIDIIEYPLKFKRDMRNQQLLLGNLDNLRKRIKKLNPKKVVFVLPRRSYLKEIKKRFPEAEVYTWKKYLV